MSAFTASQLRSGLAGIHPLLSFGAELKTFDGFSGASAINGLRSSKDTAETQMQNRALGYTRVST
jgi:hypothetical protein